MPHEGNGNGGGNGDGNGNGDTGVKGAASTLWGFLSTLVVVGALVFLTWYLAHHYSTAADAAQILGIVVPVFAAAFGGALGYWTGNTTGTTQGQAQGRQQAKAAAQPKLRQADQAITDLVTKIREGGTSPAGTGVVRFDQTLPAPVTFNEEDLSFARDAVADARSAVEGL